MIGSKNKTRLSFLGALAVAILAAFLVFSQNLTSVGIVVPAFLRQPFLLGLDLQGGTHLVYEADMSQISPDERQSALEGVRDVIEKRVNAFGVSEPLVQTTESNNQHRLIIELAGITNVNEAIEMIGETPLLEFKTVNENPDITLTEDQQNQITESEKQAQQKANEIIKRLQDENADFSQLAKEESKDPGTAAQGGDLGALPRGILAPEFEKVCFDELQTGQTYPEPVKTQFGYHIIRKNEHTVAGENSAETARCQHILLTTLSKQDFITQEQQWTTTQLGGKQLERAVVQFDPNTNQPSVGLQFNEEGKKIFSEITQANIGRPVAIFLDGQAISIPTVQEAINDGQAVISGQFTVSEARLLAQRLNAGALPVPIKLISQQTVGATLGNTSLAKSLNAGIIGLLLVSLFMVLYYRLPGIAAVVALIFYGLIVLSIFKLIPVTLTLAGMAGFILSLGMAVDANVLIFERLKEELKSGKPLNLSAKEAFKRAWPSILDGNVSTLITCVILMGFTTSLVKGFAITLSIGILVSMFSAMVITKIILSLFISTGFLQKSWLYGVKK